MTDKYYTAVQHTIKTGTDSINWSKALQIIDSLNKSRNHDQVVFSAIHNFACSGDRRTKLNSISFIDAMFKNGNQALLTALQTSPSILGISDDPIVADPYVHRILCSNAESWVAACQGSHCLVNAFLDWQRRLFSFKYRYVMTPEMQTKFSSDFSTAFELLSMFSQELIKAKNNRTSPDNETLIDMLTNVNEVHQRLRELEDTMSDKYVLSIIHYLEDYCDIAKQCYTLYSQMGQFDVELLQDISQRGIPNPNSPDSRAQQKPQQQAPPQQQGPPQQFVPQAPPQQFVPQAPPQQAPPVQPPQQPQTNIIDDLLDLGSDFNTPQKQPQQPQQTGGYQNPQYQQQFNQPNPQFQPQPQQFNNAQFQPQPQQFPNQQFQPQPQQFNNAQFQPQPQQFPNQQFQPQPQQFNNAQFQPQPQQYQNPQYQPQPQQFNNAQFQPPPQQYQPQQHNQNQANDFEFAPDVPNGGVSDQQFLNFLDNIQKK